MNYVHDAAKNQKCPLYLIVDEYDNFTDTVLNEKGENIYHAMTHASGFYRDVFKKFKGNYDRILMMGVSPVTLDDLTSGYNIATGITMDARFNQMLGFSETEVREMIRYYQSAGVLQADEEQLITEMKPWSKSGGTDKGKKVQFLTAGTQLHLIVAQIQGYERKRVEEISCL